MVNPTADLSAWRSPPTVETPLVEPSSLPQESPFSPLITNNKALGDNEGLLHPAFLPPCEHGGSNGDMHAHAFDLLSLANAARPQGILPGGPFSTPSLPVIPASVPTHPTSVLSATRPPTTTTPSASGFGPAPKARRMSSSTTGVLGRGKLGLTGEGLQVGSLGKDGRPMLLNASSYSGQTPIPNRRPVAAVGTSPIPQLFDFAKTDRRPSASRPTTTLLNHRAVSASAAVPASLPTRSNLLPQRLPSTNVMELDMEFDGDEDDDGEIEGGSGRSGSQELEMDMDMDMDEGGGPGGEGKDWKRLALGSGSGGVKGRRKGMVFKCESCSKEYRHPSCLVKHRWEHSPHWKEPTQLSMSKHQQVQMLEAAAILAHLQPALGRALPDDKSLWPAMLSPPGEHAQLRRPSHSGHRDLSSFRSPASIADPLTPSSLREVSALALSMGTARKTSPGSDSTTSSNGVHSEPYIPNTRPVGIQQPPHHTNHTSISSSSVPGPGTPQSLGSLPNESSGLHFHTGTSFNNRSSFNNNHGVSPIPNRGYIPGMSYKAGMTSGGMFGVGSGMRPGSLSLSREVPNSSVRSGAGGEDEEEEEDGEGRKRKSSSEEAEEKRKMKEGEEWGMAMEMEL